MWKFESQLLGKELFNYFQNIVYCSFRYFIAQDADEVKRVLLFCKVEKYTGNIAVIFPY